VLLLSAVDADSRYLTGVLPGIVCFGLGLGTLVAPLTAAVLGAVPDSETGIASAVNNAAARLAGLITVAAVPVAAGMGGLEQLDGAAFVEGYRRSLWISAGLCVAGAIIAFTTIRRGGRIEHAMHPSPSQACAQRRVAPAAD
ncbi:MAG: MFS transporter, partial [Longimicrobiales bacterium]